MFEEKFTLNVSEQNIIEKINSTDNLKIEEIYNNLGEFINTTWHFRKSKKNLRGCGGK
jgi:hypothetical protein